MAALAAALIPSLISGAAGFFGGKKQNTTTGTQDTTGSSQQINHAVQTGGGSGTGASRNYGSGATANSGVGTNVHNLTPLQQMLATQLGTGASNLANTATDMSGYTNNGLQGINDASGAQSIALKNILASRGLSYSPAAANAEVGNQQNRLNQQTSFLQGIPLLQRAQQERAQTGLVNAFSALPTDTTTTSDTQGTYQNENQGATSFDNSNYSNTDSETDAKNKSNTNQTGTVSGNPIAGLLGGLGAGLVSPNGSGGNNMGSIIDIISSLFGGGRSNSGSDLGFG